MVVADRVKSPPEDQSPVSPMMSACCHWVLFVNENKEPVLLQYAAVSMLNQTHIDVLTLSGFQGLQPFGALYFCIASAGYLLILLLNVSILVLICGQRRLHQPMYIFLANLLLNTLIGCVAFYPKLLHDLLCEVQLISRTGCILQAFWVHMYVSVECSILTVMAYDRYAAVVHPLTYHSLLNSSMVCKLLAAAWMLPLVGQTCLMSLSSMLPLCASHISRTFCDNRSISNLSCVDISLISLLEIVIAAIVVFLPLLLIFSCYVKILIISVPMSKTGRASKALSTCIPHLVTYVSFVTSIVFEVIQPALATKTIPQVIRVVMSMEGFMVPPLLNPLIYGLTMTDIRNDIRRLFRARLPLNMKVSHC
ncbi:olfactory receptor 6N1-like [Aulostomus maculatus]